MPFPSPFTPAVSYTHTHTHSLFFIVDILNDCPLQPHFYSDCTSCAQRVTSRSRVQTRKLKKGEVKGRCVCRALALGWEEGVKVQEKNDEAQETEEEEGRENKNKTREETQKTIRAERSSRRRQKHTANAELDTPTLALLSSSSQKFKKKNEGMLQRRGSTYKRKSPRPEMRMLFPLTQLSSCPPYCCSLALHARYL